MNRDCLLCGEPLLDAKFVIRFQDRLIHVTCEQGILNEPWYGAGSIIEYGIHGARGAQ